jgi:SAM-dependent methyltransferase
MKRGSSENYRDLIIRAIEEDPGFLRLTLSGPRDPKRAPCLKISFRPVTLREERRIQVIYEKPTQNAVRNLEADELKACLTETLHLPFTRLHLQLRTGDVHIRITKKGNVLMTHSAPSRQDASLPTAHDRTRTYFLNGDRPDTFLQAIGLQNEKGELRASLRDKFRQINGFINLLSPLFPEKSGKPLFLVDCGCGSAWLTFAVYHYLHQIRGRSAKIAGIDVKEEVIAKCAALRDKLHWTDMEFQVSTIAAYQPQVEPDLVLSLHACDTATDEAIARGILWNSRGIVAAPCCQHELHRQLSQPAFAPLLRHGILRERLADLLTDTFRALVLRIMGYRVQVMEFVAPDATPKNLMIRAERGLPPGDAGAVQEYRDLKQYWQVTPCIESLLGDRFTRWLEKP